MALKVVERGRAYFKSGLMVTAQSFDYTHTNGDELADGTDGSNYQTIGNERVEVGLQLIVPKDATGENTALNIAIANHETFQMTFYIGGTFMQIDGFANSIAYKSDSKNGLLTADVKAMAGKPKILS